MYYQVYRDAAREYRWRAKAANHQIIATSGEGYKNKADCVSAIHILKSNPDAPIKEV